MNYHSPQFVANRRWPRGVDVMRPTPGSPRWTEDGSDNGGSSLHRPHHPRAGPRTVLHAPESPHHRLGRVGVAVARPPGLLNLLGGWSIAPMFVYQSGQPWRMPGNVELLGDPSRLRSRRPRTDSSSTA